MCNSFEETSGSFSKGNHDLLLNQTYNTRVPSILWIQYLRMQFSFSSVKFLADEPSLPLNFLYRSPFFFLPPSKILQIASYE